MAMRERPILMSPPMVVSTLNNTKTQTRRIVKPQPHYEPRFAGDGLVLHQKKGDKTTSIHTPLIAAHCPYGEPGDRLWVRETWMPDPPRDGTWPHVAFDGCKPRDMKLIPEQYRTPKHCLYRADCQEKLTGWTPAIHMFRWASRITLEITRVRVERLQDISDADCIAEGIGLNSSAAGVKLTFPPGASACKAGYQALWETLNGPDSWAANPWVWAIDFKRITP